MIATINNINVENSEFKANTNDLIRCSDSFFSDLSSDSMEECARLNNLKLFLLLASKMSSYSLRNLSLIYLQYPNAVNVAGFVTWKKLGRIVKQGEHGIKILAPRKYKLKDEDENDVERLGFSVVNVFDYSQTKPLKKNDESDFFKFHDFIKPSLSMCYDTLSDLYKEDLSDQDIFDVTQLLKIMTFEEHIDSYPFIDYSCDDVKRIINIAKEVYEDTINLI